MTQDSDSAEHAPPLLRSYADGATSDWLYDGALSRMNNLPGCPERQELSVLLSHAKILRFDESSSRAIQETISYCPDSIARNVEFFCPTLTPTWIEMKTTPAIGGSSDYETNYGILLARAPEGPLRWIGYAFLRQPNGVIQESYALLHWDDASLARISLSEAALEALIHETRVSIPPGFEEELKILTGIDDPSAYADLIIRVKQSAFECAAPAIAAWLLLDSNRLVLDQDAESRIRASLQSRRGWQNRLWRTLKRPGFGRTLTGSLTWFPPATDLKAPLGSEA